MSAKRKKVVIKATKKDEKMEEPKAPKAPKEEKADVSVPEQKSEPPKLMDAEKLREQEDKAREERLAIAASGVIPDPRVYRLLYLEKCAVEASLQSQVRKKAYEERINVLKQEANQIIRTWEATQRQSIRKIADVRREIEEDYGIFFSHWGYDDEAGVLQKLTPEEIEALTPQKKVEEKEEGEKKEEAQEAQEGKPTSEAESDG